jgi:XTP/dITP diphosphohydrolase
LPERRPDDAQRPRPALPSPAREGLDLVIATGNPGKLQEYRDLLSGTDHHLIPYSTEVEEVGATYEANARLKAEAAVAATGLAAVADDSGVEVEALGGFPGLRSARLAPTQPERTRALVERLQGVPRPWKARFVCVTALARPGSATLTFRGEARGEIVPEWRGGVGFGYDPVFLVPEVGLTFGEMEPAQKHQWSHRGTAVRKLIESGALDA